MLSAVIGSHTVSVEWEQPIGCCASPAPQIDLPDLRQLFAGYEMHLLVVGDSGVDGGSGMTRTRCARSELHALGHLPPDEEGAM